MKICNNRSQCSEIKHGIESVVNLIKMHICFNFDRNKSSRTVLFFPLKKTKQKNYNARKRKKNKQLAKCKERKKKREKESHSLNADVHDVFDVSIFHNMTMVKMNGNLPSLRHSIYYIRLKKKTTTTKNDAVHGNYFCIFEYDTEKCQQTDISTTTTQKKKKEFDSFKWNGHIDTHIEIEFIYMMNTSEDLRTYSAHSVRFCLCPCTYIYFINLINIPFLYRSHLFNYTFFRQTNI